MEISNLRKDIGDRHSSKPVRDETPVAARSRSRSTSTSEKREAAPAAPPQAAKRPQSLVTTVNKSLTQSGIAAVRPETVPETSGGTPEEVPGAAAAATVQQEKAAAEALQAFTHALLKSVTTETLADPSGSTVTSAPIQTAATSPPPSTSVGAYEGLVSRLEDLVRAIDGERSSSAGNEELAQLDAAFRDLIGVSSDHQSGSTPELQTVLRNMIRNLQSSGDPTLASTGNVINTAA